MAEVLVSTILLVTASYVHNSNTAPVTSVLTSVPKGPGTPRFQHPLLPTDSIVQVNSLIALPLALFCCLDTHI